MRRIVVFGLGFLGALWALTAAAVACDRVHSGADWACLYVEHMDTGACVQNPLPQDLPVDAPDDVQLVPDDIPEVAPVIESVLPLVPDVKPELPSTGDMVSLVASAGAAVPGGNGGLVPGNPVSLLQSVPTEAPKVPYEPTGMPGTPI